MRLQVTSFSFIHQHRKDSHLSGRLFQEGETAGETDMRPLQLQEILNSQAPRTSPTRVETRFFPWQTLLHPVCTDVTTQYCLLKACLLTLRLRNLTGAATRSTGTPSLFASLWFAVLFFWNHDCSSSRWGSDISAWNTHRSVCSCWENTNKSFPKC